jgi:hypothetical protein
MAKKKTNKEAAKNENELAKKDKVENSEILATMTRNGKTANPSYAVGTNFK